MIKTFLWLEPQDYVTVCVLSDSMSMIRKVQTGMLCRQWMESMQESKICSTTFIFVPGHARIQDNERADKLACVATISEGQPMDRAEIINSIRDIGGVVDFDRLESMSRLHELGVKIAITKSEKYSRLLRTSSELCTNCYALIDILRGRSEHL